MLYCILFIWQKNTFYIFFTLYLKVSQSVATYLFIKLDEAVRTEQTSKTHMYIMYSHMKLYCCHRGSCSSETPISPLFVSNCGLSANFKILCAIICIFLGYL